MYKENDPDWAPSVNLGYSMPSDHVRDSTHYERLQSRKRMREEQDDQSVDGSTQQEMDQMVHVDNTDG